MNSWKGGEEDNAYWLPLSGMAGEALHRQRVWLSRIADLRFEAAATLYEEIMLLDGSD